MKNNNKLLMVCGIIFALCFTSFGCISLEDKGTDDLSDTVIEGKYLGKNKLNDSVIKITKVENSPKAEEVYAIVQNPNAQYLDWHAFGENPGKEHPISAISHIDIWRTADTEDISWNDIYEDHKLLPDEEFFISNALVPPVASDYKFILKHKSGKVLLEVEIGKYEAPGDPSQKPPEALKCEPEVKVTGYNYTENPHLVPYQEVHTKFAQNYTGSNLSTELRNLTMDCMAEKANELGENATILKESIKVTYYDWEARPYRIPCYAEKAKYNNDWIWAIAFNRANGFEDGISHFDLFFVSISTIQAQYMSGCNSTAIVFQDGCD